MMADLARGRVLIKNWHEFEPGTPEGGGGARVVRAGKPEVRNETIVIADRMTSARGSRYYTPQAYAAAKAGGTIRVRSEESDDAGNVRRAEVTVTRYIESDGALVDRVLKEAGGRQNILVINDEAHHAYRIPPKIDDVDDDLFDDDEDDEEEEEASRKEATVWIERTRARLPAVAASTSASTLARRRTSSAAWVARRTPCFPGSSATSV